MILVTLLVVLGTVQGAHARVGSAPAALHGSRSRSRSRETRGLRRIPIEQFGDLETYIHRNGTAANLPGLLARIDADAAARGELLDWNTFKVPQLSLTARATDEVVAVYVDELAKRGVDLATARVCDPIKYSMLCFAARIGHVRTVEALLRHGVTTYTASRWTDRRCEARTDEVAGTLVDLLGLVGYMSKFGIRISNSNVPEDRMPQFAAIERAINDAIERQRRNAPERRDQVMLEWVLREKGLDNLGQTICKGLLQDPDYPGRATGVPSDCYTDGVLTYTNAQ